MTNIKPKDTSEEMFIDDIIHDLEALDFNSKEAREVVKQALAQAEQRGYKKGFDYVHEKMDFDGEMHRQGKCSFPLVSICSAEEHKIKNILYEALNPPQEKYI